MDKVEAINNVATGLEAAAAAVNFAVGICHGVAVGSGWWNDPHTGEDLHGRRNIGEMLALIHSEISEALEGHRKTLMDDHLPQYMMFDVELADAVIRIFDLAGSEGINLGQILAEKLAYNIHREDHKHENRIKEGGKAF